MARARTFRDLIALVRRAEDALIRVAGQSDLADRVTTLRGIYYGTEWSLDYRVERSTIRNLGFLTYTGGSVPADPRPALGQELFNDLQASQSMTDRGRRIDIGHLLIGVDTRSSAVMRTVPIPGQGGTGLEIVTWLGDLGGGAASLAFRRVTNPGASVAAVFHNRASDYGVSDNLEGDIGGYLVACGTVPGGAPTYARGQTVADLLAAYLPVTDERQWLTRAARFASAIGATVSPAGVTNAATLVGALASKFYDFAVWYTATRYVPSGQLRGQSVITACQHLRGAANEVATVFVRTLSQAVADQGRPVAAQRPYPTPTSPGSCESRLLNASATDVSQIRREYENIRRSLQRLFE